MAPTNSQSTRMGKLHTPLGEDKLVLLDFSGSEHVNDLFKFSVTALSEEEDLVDFDELLGHHCSVEITTITGESRWFDGIITGAQHMGREMDGHSVRFELRPWFWLLGNRVNSRIFHEMNVKDILKELLGAYAGLGSPAYKDSLTKSYPSLEYTVQYRESDLNFARRLMEEYGINLHFEMVKDSHTMVLTDDTGSFETLDGSKRPFFASAGQNRADIEHFSEWIPNRQITSGMVRLMDYEFKKPTQNMKVEAEDTADYEQGDMEVYDYPGKYIVDNDGKPMAQRRLDALRSQDASFEAAGDVLSLGAGMIVTLEEHPDKDLNKEYVALSCEHHYTSEGYRSGIDASGDEGYKGSYVLALTTAPLAPLRKTPRGVVNGPQTAVVTGDGEIDCDEHGRILVQFFWDTDGAKSMRCRVAQSWSGKAWGSIYIPRVGMEVVVEYLDGDPDRPIVTGAVYNGDNTPPFELPANKTISGVKSYSSPGGGGYNSLTFEDKAGKEVIDIHGQKDLTVLIENDETREIKHDFSGTVGNNSTEEIAGDRKQTIKKSREVEISQSDKLDVGQTLDIEAKSKITLKVGQSTITMDPSSITIKSPSITIDAKMELKTKGGMMAEHKAGAMMDIKAGMVKINS